MVKIISSTAVADPNKIQTGVDPRDALFEMMQSNPGAIIPGTTPTNMTVTPSSVPELRAEIPENRGGGWGGDA